MNHRRGLPAYRGGDNYAGADPASQLLRAYQDMDEMLQRVQRIWGDNSGQLGRQHQDEPDALSLLGLGERWPRFGFEEKEDAYHLEVELPGIRPEDVDVCVTSERLLRISGSRRSTSKKSPKETGEADGKTQRTRFSRIVSLPFDVDEDAISARFEHGILEIELPKSAESDRIRRISVETGRTNEHEAQGKPESKADTDEPRSGNSTPKPKDEARTPGRDEDKPSGQSQHH